ncbi:MAG: nicotinate phosphoribosyltransferase [Microthrixaceae bacterium]|nr:nicotinate phosphoribosyltransferase [Microthrixaceae bacterium]
MSPTRTGPTHDGLLGGMLSTDFYQLTMAQLYFRAGLADRPARFEHFFRSYPDYGRHQAGYCISAGLAPFARWMTSVRPTDADLEALAGHRGSTGEALFADDFLGWFGGVDFASLTVDAVPEGRVVHPNTPITVVEGPLAAAQLLETALLNRLNFPTLIATKAARVAEAALGRPVLEFGMRRAAGAGADAATRAALVGGATSTSNTAAGFTYGVDPAGTHAHSMIQAYLALGLGERAAFQAYADVYPDDCVLLVDTVDTLGSGVPNAIAVFEDLRRRGHRPAGIRLDSGDLAYLTIQAARQLNEAGFDEAAIVLSSRLDELTIWQITHQIREEASQEGLDAQAVIDRLVFGVGSRLTTSEGSPSLDGVFKLVALQQDGAWKPAIKRSDTPEKVLNPGAKRLWRLTDRRGMATADVLSTADERLRPGDELVLHHHAQPHVSRRVNADDCADAEELSVRVIAGGEVACDGGQEALDDLEAIAARRSSDVAALGPGVRRLVNPHTYHVSITERVWRLKRDLLTSLT